jgi:hypothetical protein
VLKQLQILDRRRRRAVHQTILTDSESERSAAMSISMELNSLLKTMDYPAYKSDLVREAIRDRINQAELTRLQNMMPRSYSGRYDVLRELKFQRTPHTPAVVRLAPAT